MHDRHPRIREIIRELATAGREGQLHEYWDDRNFHIKLIPINLQGGQSGKGSRHHQFNTFKGCSQ